jgi:hypothetical protein
MAFFNIIKRFLQNCEKNEPIFPVLSHLVMQVNLRRRLRGKFSAEIGERKSSFYKGKVDLEAGSLAPYTRF